MTGTSPCRRARPRGRDSAPKQICLGGAILLACLSATAFAENKVLVRLEGEIAPECAIEEAHSGGASLAVPIQLGDIAKAGRFDFGFTLNCNAPFTYRVEAQNGALTHEAGAAVPGFTAAVPYRVAVNIPMKNRVIGESCSGDSIRTGRATCGYGDSGSDIALGAQSRLTVSWPSSGRAPLAGSFKDRLNISVAVRH